MSETNQARTKQVKSRDLQSHQNETYELCDNVYIQYADSYITKMEEVFNAGSSMFLSHNGIQKMPLRDNTIAPWRQVVDTSL